MVADLTTYRWLLRLLDDGAARYRLLTHAAEGRTQQASALRGNPLAQAAKCIVVRVSLGGKLRRYLIGVVAGDRRIDLDRVRRLYGGTKVAFAQRSVAERLTGCASGSIIPFTIDPGLDLVVDEELAAHDEVYFNAARLDRSIALAMDDYLALARPRLAAIAARPAAAQPTTEESHVPFTHQHPVPDRLQWRPAGG